MVISELSFIKHNKAAIAILDDMIARAEQGIADINEKTTMEEMNLIIALSGKKPSELEV